MREALRLWLFLTASYLLLGMGWMAVAGTSKEEDQRTAMVEKLRQRGINNKAVLDAMERVPRHLFVNREDQERAYSSAAIPIAKGQVLQAPFAVATELQRLNPKRGDRILQVGAECGYYAAVLEELNAKVFVIDIRQDVLRAAQKRCDSLHCRNISWRCDDGCKGWREHAPYDGILVMCAADCVPPELYAQLRNGGRMIVPIGVRPERTVQCVTKVSDRKVRTEALTLPLEVDPMACRKPLP